MFIKTSNNNSKNVVILLGGSSAERHISVESGRNIYEKLLSSEKYNPTPVYLVERDGEISLFTLPIHILLKDNADDIEEYLLEGGDEDKKKNMSYFRENLSSIVKKYGNAVDDPTEISFKDLKKFDFVFLALHGSPGEDGTVQKILDDLKISYNGSGSETSKLCINKYATNQFLKSKGFNVAEQFLFGREDFLKGEEIINLKEKIDFPCIAKPEDDGCSSFVERIYNFENLKVFCKNFFDQNPKKKNLLIEEFIFEKKGERLMEITGGFLTHHENDKIEYEIFYPSESVASKGILSLEEKFLAGEGKNITPAFFSADEFQNEKIMVGVKKIFLEVAKILNLKGYARIDAFIKFFSDNSFKIYIIEVNTLPAMTSATCIFHQCILNGYKPLDFIEKIIEFGFKSSKS